MLKEIKTVFRNNTNLDNAKSSWWETKSDVF